MTTVHSQPEELSCRTTSPARYLLY